MPKRENMRKTVREWIEISEYDLCTAEAMLKTKRFLYVMFMCQQAVEKILKAIYAMNSSGLPPRTHNLLYLVDALEISLREEELMLLSRLNQFYLESRYPGERIKLAKAVNKDKAREMLEKTKGVWKCLRQKLL